jgi:hypothetical protein
LSLLVPFTCPECGGREFLEGPHGGLSVNFCCAKCFARFNDAWPFSIDRHGFIEESERCFFRGSYKPIGKRAKQPLATHSDNVTPPGAQSLKETSESLKETNFEKREKEGQS